MFLGFANFYWRFIQRFSRIAVPLTLMLKISESTESSIQFEQSVVKVGGDSKAGRDRTKLDGSKFNDDEVDGGEDKVDEVGKKVQETSKSKNLSKSQNSSKSKKR